MGQPIAGSNPALSAPPPPAPRPGRSSRPCYHRPAVLGGELAVPCTCNPLQQGRIPSRGRCSRRPTAFATLRTGSRAAATREPCQVRKEAALSDDRRVPRNGLVRAAFVGGRGSGRIDGGCTALRLVVLLAAGAR